MSFTPTTFIDAWRPSSGEDDLDLVTNQDLYLLGQLVDEKEILDFDVSYKNKSHQQMGLWYMKNSKGNYNLIDIPANFKVTNGTLFFQMLGQVNNSPGGELDHAVTMLDTDYAIGEKPRVNLLTHSGGDNKQIFGCVMKELNLTWENTKGYLVAQTKYDALHWKRSLWSGDTYHPGASTGTVGEFKPFNILETLTWDSDDDTIITVDSPFAVNVQMLQKLGVSPGTGANLGMNSEIDDSLAISTIITLSYWGRESQFEDDYDNDDMGDFNWKMKKPDSGGVDKYFDLTISDCKVTKPMPFRNNGEPVGYATILQGGQISVDIKDNLHDYFYTYPRE